MAPAWSLAWPGPQDGLGQGGARLEWAKGRFGSKIDEKMKVLRMGLPIVESLSGPQESIFRLFRGPQLNSCKKNKLKNKVLRMSLPIVENLSGLQESIFNLSRGPQLHFGEKSKKCRILLNLSIFPLSPCLGSLGLLSLQ